MSIHFGKNIKKELPPTEAEGRILVLRYTVTKNFIVADRVLFLPYAITGVTFDRVNDKRLYVPIYFIQF